MGLVETNDLYAAMECTDDGIEIVVNYNEVCGGHNIIHHYKWKASSLVH